MLTERTWRAVSARGFRWPERFFLAMTRCMYRLSVLRFEGPELPPLYMKPSQAYAYGEQRRIQ